MSLCMCGADDCILCRPERFFASGEYREAECVKCGSEFIREKEEDEMCETCKRDQEDITT